jgi:hypothetical protein
METSSLFGRIRLIFRSDTILHTSFCEETLVLVVLFQLVLKRSKRNIYFNNTEEFSDPFTLVIHRTWAPIKFILYYCSLLISIAHNREKRNMIIAL